MQYSKSCLSRRLKKKTKIGIQDRLSLVKHCRMLLESILQYFLPSLSYHLSLRPLFCVAVLDRVYCHSFFLVPEIAKTKSWPSMERNGWLLLWYHAEGADPTWLPSEVEDITKRRWTYGGRTESYMNCHISVKVSIVSIKKEKCFLPTRPVVVYTILKNFKAAG